MGGRTPTWGRFGKRAVLESDHCERLEVRCQKDSVLGARTWPSPRPRSSSSTRFTYTLWRSRDLLDNDNPSAWTKVFEDEEDPIFDVAHLLFDVQIRNLAKVSRQYGYANFPGEPPVGTGPDPP